MADLIKREDAHKRLAFVLEEMGVSLFGIKGERLAKLILDEVPAANLEEIDCPNKEYPCAVCEEQTDCPWK